MPRIFITAFNISILTSIGLYLFIVSPESRADAQTNYKNCVLDSLKIEKTDKTVDELIDACRDEFIDTIDTFVTELESADRKSMSALDRRIQAEQLTASVPFLITPHKSNYFLFPTYNFSNPNQEPFTDVLPAGSSFEQVEAKFQISFKVSLVKEIFNQDSDLNFAYTNRSFWQMLNKELSEPFRETNHEPELWLQFNTDWSLFGFRNRLLYLGVVHQSNGMSGTLSRSWNRVYVQFILERQDFYFSIKPWVRIPDDEEEDDNPDIEHYLGNFEFYNLFKRGKTNISLMLRNNFNRSENRGAIQFEWSFPLYRRFRGYVQWFNGYGESLIDYNVNVNTIGFGIRLTDVL